MTKQSPAVKAALAQGEADMRRLLEKSGFVSLSGFRARPRAQGDLENDCDDDDDDIDDGDDANDGEDLVASFSQGHFSRPSKSGRLNVYRRRTAS